MITRTFTTLDGVERIAEFSDCLRYRYSLLIRWDKTLPVQMLIGLNPSKADERRNDPTVLRGIDYCHRWNKGGLLMANAFAFRATDPREMLRAADPIGDDNTAEYLEYLAVNVASGTPIACWGTKAAHMNRGRILKAVLGRLDCLRMTKEGYPQHPLYLPAALTPIPFNYSRGE